jgi:hypothetical protein
MKTNKNEQKNVIPRKEALKIIGNYGKYIALTSLATYIILDPKKAQAMSGPSGGSPGGGGGF